MYQALLTKRYVFSKIMPLLAAGCVALCCALVLIVWCVMTGFLDTLVQSGRTVSGDVAVTWNVSGFGNYKDLIARLEAEKEEVEAASPVISTYGLIALSSGQKITVEVRGIDIESYKRVLSYEKTLWWRPIPEYTRRDVRKEDPRADPKYKEALKGVYANGLTLTRVDPDTNEVKPAAVLGINVTGYNVREDSQIYTPRRMLKPMPDGTQEVIDDFLPLNGDIALSVLVLDEKARGVQTETLILPVANEFESGVFDVDSKLVLVPLPILQKALRMDGGVREATKLEIEAGKARKAKIPGLEDFAGGDERWVVDEPARVTSVIVKSKKSVDKLGQGAQFRDFVRGVYAKFEQAYPGQVPSSNSQFLVQSWEDQNRGMISAVQKEIGLVMFLFIIMSCVCIILVLTIFWAMVAEKTKDIGILRALGASRSGIAWLWVRYGLLIGVVGSICGVATAWVVVTNINPIHEWLGRTLSIVVWDPSVYYFKEIPSHVDPYKAVIAVVGFIIACGVGAFIPAIRAAWMKPVTALRFE